VHTHGAPSTEHEARTRMKKMLTLDEQIRLYDDLAGRAANVRRGL
jgi:hypothetical protein